MKLKASLLYEIFTMQHNDPMRYSKAYLNLCAVVEIEEQEDNTFNVKLLEEFRKLQQQYHLFIDNIPLPIAQDYYSRNLGSSMNKFIYMEYQNEAPDSLLLSDLFLRLEEFYSKVYILACKIANMYNIEIKVNTDYEVNEKEYV